MQKRSEAEEYEIYRRYVLNDGFCIPKLRIDMPLYRYRRNTKFTINEIQTGNIYLASLGELNDPFDSSYAQQYVVRPNKRCKNCCRPYCCFKCGKLHLCKSIYIEKRYFKSTVHSCRLPIQRKCCILIGVDERAE